MCREIEDPHASFLFFCMSVERGGGGLVTEEIRGQSGNISSNGIDDTKMDHSFALPISRNRTAFHTEVASVLGSAYFVLSQPHLILNHHPHTHHHHLFYLSLLLFVRQLHFESTHCWVVSISSFSLDRFSLLSLTCGVSPLHGLAAKWPGVEVLPYGSRTGCRVTYCVMATYPRTSSFRLLPFSCKNNIGPEFVGDDRLKFRPVRHWLCVHVLS